MNQSDIYHYQYEAWLYDIMEPGNEIYMDRMLESRHAWTEPFPEHLIKNSPEQITDLQREEREDDFLRKHGII